MWIGLAFLIVKVMHGSVKSNQISREHFAGQDAARTAEQIAAEASTAKIPTKQVFTDD